LLCTTTIYFRLITATCSRASSTSCLVGFQVVSLNMVNTIQVYERSSTIFIHLSNKIEKKNHLCIFIIVYLFIVYWNIKGNILRIIYYNVIYYELLKFARYKCVWISSATILIHLSNKIKRKKSFTVHGTNQVILQHENIREHCKRDKLFCKNWSFPSWNLFNE